MTDEERKQFINEYCRNVAHKPMTNEEWLRTLPADEQVKEVLSRGFMTEKRTAEDFVELLNKYTADSFILKHMYTYKYNIKK